MSDSSWVKIGIVGKAHGLYGAFFLSGRDQSLDKSVVKLVIGDNPDAGTQLTIKNHKNHTSRTIVQTVEITNREQLETVKGKAVWCLRADITVDDSEYLWDDLIGLDVIDKDGVRLGVVVRMNNYGASDIVELQGDDKKTLSIPFVENYFDMSFATDDCLTLLVGAETFEGTWE